MERHGPGLRAGMCRRRPCLLGNFLLVRRRGSLCGLRLEGGGRRAVDRIGLVALGGGSRLGRVGRGFVNRRCGGRSWVAAGTVAAEGRLEVVMSSHLAERGMVVVEEVGSIEREWSGLGEERTEEVRSEGEWSGLAEERMEEVRSIAELYIDEL